ncbi:hypothetical protein Lalb_Chr13g0300651 [Lupinus albus]|uniref:Uncharacterized protein n=1 Tax=Lupinus albus TaxID=3870 RepID=A0A6A4PJT2_LUPAL|nr:hypothetical protein Lalb_Chr13g0300651 [Lupinus albus]
MMILLLWGCCWFWWQQLKKRRIQYEKQNMLKHVAATRDYKILMRQKGLFRICEGWGGCGKNTVPDQLLLLPVTMF